jgi:AcrR family transcriptional regulator
MVHSLARSTPRQQKREVTFDRIIEAAMRVVSAGGLDALTMQGLAADLGFAVGALYRYFPGKDGVVVAVQRRIVEAIGEELAAALGRADLGLARGRALPPRQAVLVRLWLVVNVYESMATTRPTEFGLLSMTLGDPRRLVQDQDAAELVPAMSALLQLVGGLFTAAAAAGALKAGDAARRTLVLWTSVQGALQLRKLERFQVGAIEATAVLHEAVTTLLVGWGARAEDTESTRQRAKKLAAANAARAKG